jgi:predicted peptidase
MFRAHQAHTRPHAIIGAHQYLLYLPQDYDPQSAKRWPLVLFLHGSGERGDNLHMVAHHGPSKHVEEGQHFPFILVSPQCPAHGWWSREPDVHALAELLDEIESNYAVDPDRVYVTGLSMGGYGVWSLAIAYPHRFAAIAPICGGGNPWTVSAIRHIPVWAFHGDQDRAVPIEDGKAMVDAHRACGGNANLTIYPGVGHDSWTQTYANQEFYNWLLAQRRNTDQNNFLEKSA